MSVIKEESDTPSDLETLARYDLVDSEEKICLRDVKPLGPNKHITPPSHNEGHNASCVASTSPDLSTVTVKLEIGNADDKGCNAANHNASGPSPSIPPFIGESDEFKLSASNRPTSDSITIDQHKPISSVSKTIDDENWIKKKPHSPTDSSQTLSMDTIVIHSVIDDLVSGNVHLENDIAGKPLYSNNTPSVDSDFKGVKHEPSEEHLAAQQSGSHKSTVDDIETAEMMVGKQNPKVIIQRLESKSSRMRNGGKNIGKSRKVKKILPNIDPDTSSQRQKGTFVCRICSKKYFLSSNVKKHMIQKHPQSRDLCVLLVLVQKAYQDSDNDSLLVWFCPRNCNYLTSEYNALSEHLVTCQKPDLLPHCNRADNVEIGNNLSLFEFDEDNRNTNAEGLNPDTQKTGQASDIPGQALEDEMQTMEQDLPTCQLCNSIFSTNLLLEGHLKDCLEEQRMGVRRGEKKFKCSRCDKRFSQSSELHIHNRSCTGDKPYKCNYCDKRYSQSGHLHIHIRTHTGDKPYKCSHCDKVFSQRGNLNRHMRTHRGDKPYKCNYCDKRYSQSGPLHIHIRTHTGDKPYKCSHCDKGFSEKGRLHRHMITHTGDKPYKCNHCDKRFSQSGDLHIHNRTHTGENPYKCNHCNKRFSHSSHLQRHMRIHTGDKPYKCSHCDKGFSVKGNLHRHMITHTVDRPYKCNHCDKGYCQIGHLHRHMITHRGEKPYKCNHCDKRFSQSGHLHIHIRTHTGDKPYTCNHYDKRFSRSGDLQEHMRIHTGDKPYKCNHCDKCFSQRGHLHRHMITHTGDKPYKCNHCDKGYCQRGQLHRHMITHTGDKPYKCNHCDKAYCQRSHLHRHIMITHTGDKPYKCNHCDKRFSQSGDLQKHRQIHTGDKPYKCSHCDKCFSQRGHLHRHMRTHTGEKPYKCNYCDKRFSQSGHLHIHIIRTHTGYKPYKCNTV